MAWHGVPPGALLRAMRPKQWIKNGFVALPALFSEQWSSYGSVAIAIACFCLVSSGVYLVNDVLDRETDRAHPRKRSRPVASGALSIRAALGSAGVLFAAGLVTAAVVEPALAMVLVAYIAINVAYTFGLKHQPILDVIAIAAGFVLRVVAGAVVIEVSISDWILICAGLLALMLGFAKRRGELVTLDDDGAAHRRVLGDYTVGFLDAMLYLTAAVTIASYAIYTTQGVPAEQHLVATLPVVFYGVVRYLWLVICRGEGESPTAVMWSDRPLQICVAVWAALSVILLSA